VIFELLKNAGASTVQKSPTRQVTTSGEVTHFGRLVGFPVGFL
jgi:hypothetical protein